MLTIKLRMPEPETLLFIVLVLMLPVVAVTWVVSHLLGGVSWLVSNTIGRVVRVKVD